MASDLARGLALRGHDVHAVVPRAAEEPAVEQPEPGLTVYRSLPRSRLPITLTDAVWTRRAARRLGNRQFDVLLGHHSSNAVGLWSARLGVPLVYLFHASGSRELRFLRPRLGAVERAASYPLEASLAAFERLVVRRAAAEVVALSEFSRSLLAADHGAHGGRAQLLPVGVDLARFSPGERSRARAALGLPDELPILVTVRRLEPRMGLENLIRALARLRRTRDAVLAVVGTGTLAEPLRRLTEELGLGDRVRFVGRVSDERLPDWYRAADLFVLPTAAYEGFGMVTAEALASGTPVVGTPIGATPELLAPLDPRLVAPGSDDVALADAVGAALDAVGPELRARCRAYAERRFDLDAAALRWEEVLAAVVERGRLAGASSHPAAAGNVS